MRLNGSSLQKCASLFFLVLLLASTAAGCVPGAQPGLVSIAADGSWQAVLPLAPAGSDLPVDPADLLEQVRAAGATADWNGLFLELAGSGGVLELRRLVYGPLNPLLNPLQPGTALELSGAVEAGEVLEFTIESNPSTGYSWALDLAGTRGLEESAAPRFEEPSERAGTPLRETLTLRAAAAGEARLRLVYRRAWEDGTAQRAVRLAAARLSDLSDLSDPTPLRYVEAIKTPAAADVRAPLPWESAASGLTPAEQLPTRFDWRDPGKVPAVRNQGACGSCWAFATVGALESAIMIQDGRTDIDLSEQYLVSCNSEGWGCNGGSTAHDYHWWKAAGSDALVGAVLESQMPYQSQNGTCAASLPRNYQIQGWGWAGDPYTPNVAAIKQAIYNYGPVKASVCVGSAFQNYAGGVFTKDERDACWGGTNHAVVLTGWDDHQGPNGVWIMRNSWGPGWGEDGYMRIDRTVSNIGRYSSYVVYEGVSYTNSIYLPNIGG